MTQLAKTHDHGPGYARDRRFFDGHFPGNPIVPGAVLLAQVSADLARTGQRITQLKRMKFLRPLGPDQSFQIQIVPSGQDWKVDFTDDQGTFAHAVVQIAAKDV